MMDIDRHYFHIAGDADLDLPAGAATIEAVRGWEYKPKSCDGRRRRRQNTDGNDLARSAR
jgi:hypothetical protein